MLCIGACTGGAHCALPRLPPARPPACLPQQPSISVELIRRMLLPEGAARWAPWDALGTMRLRELADLPGMLCLLFGEEFAAGPADLGPRFQVHLMLAPPAAAACMLCLAQFAADAGGLLKRVALLACLCCRRPPPWPWRAASYGCLAQPSPPAGSSSRDGQSLCWSRRPWVPWALPRWQNVSLLCVCTLIQHSHPALSSRVLSM